MRLQSVYSASVLSPEIARALAEVRRRRRFDARRVLEAKCALLNRYATESEIRACVVGVSGGVDSAVTLGIVRQAQLQPGSPLRRVVAALVPIFGDGTTNQDRALERGREVTQTFSTEVAVVDLSSAFEELGSATEAGLVQAGKAWGRGQLASYSRTPAFYYLTSLLTELGFRAILVGTTNRDEGAYIGFFGKASDGMVDLQLVSDLHKSEIYALAELLGVPRSVREAVPSGDVFDGRTDEQMIGTSYDFVELHGALLAAPEPERREILDLLGEEGRHELERVADVIERLHVQNRHKYLGASPAAHLDVLEREVPDTLLAEVPAERAKKITDFPSGAFVGPFELETRLVREISDRQVAPRREPVAEFGESVFVAQGLMTPAECSSLVEAFSKTAHVPVSVHGRRGFRTDAVGSLRATVYDEGLARALFRRLSEVMPRVRILDEESPTDFFGHRVWRAVGLNPVFRFIGYENGGWLVPHYDAGYRFSDDRVSLMSFVVYLTQNANASTRFLYEPQRHLRLARRVYEDAEAPSSPFEVLASVEPEIGKALVFDHRLRHEAEAFRTAPRDDSPDSAGLRLLLRTDVVFDRAAPRAFPKPLVSNLPRLPLHAALDVRREATRVEVDRAYLAIEPTARPGVREAWKILRDPYYAATYEKLESKDAVLEAAFFDDGAPAPEDELADPRWLTSPVFELEARLEEARHFPERELFVLVTTGALYPVHPGHVGLLKIAKDALEKRGGFVLGGYLAPDHDEYLREKCGPDAPDAANRIRLAEAALLLGEGFMVDPWPALYCRRKLNFTEVVDRLETHLNWRVPTKRPIRVVYVFGSDNARFSLAFAAKGRCVCVPRPGYESELQKYSQDVRVQSDRIIFANTPAPQAASSRIRAGDDSGLPEPARSLWRSWRSPGPGADAVLFVRDEGSWPLEGIARTRDRARVERAHEEFRAEVLEALKTTFGQARPPDRAGRLRLEVLSLEAQRGAAQKELAGARVLSLDPCIPGQAQLGVSRCFELAAGVMRPGLVPRPGGPSLSEQLERIEPGEYVLFDDDEATGHTQREVAALLADRCSIVKKCTLARLKDQEGRADLVDLRDFLVGGRESGLVVALDRTETARAPYLLPYVRLSERLSLPASIDLSLSRRIWELNAALYRRIEPRVTLGEASVAFQLLARRIGFAPDSTLLEICEFHTTRLGPWQR
ncbi:MAG: NAD(+) synthase [Deltaproteobacteria bacterium]|nr:NAD(+) synthase [Deltaproteobacteria bacterium]